MSLFRLWCLALACLPLVGQPIWQPRLETSWQWQLTVPVDLAVDAEMYDIDLFLNGAEVVQALHARGRRAVCYVSVGTYEGWRPDAARFPEAVKGRALEDFPDERWLDIRRLDVLGPILESRLDLCKQKGFDGVEPDNVDAYQNRSGFALTATDQLRFNRFVAAAAHARGLSVGLKNDLDQIGDLIGDFDWALNEQCFQYRECAALDRFVRAGKAVFTVEYELKAQQFCTDANSHNFNSLEKRYDLDAYRVACRATAAPGIEVTAAVNAASYRPGPLVSSEIVTLFGRGLGPGGLRVWFDGIAAPAVLYAYEQQASVVTPDLSGRELVRIEVEREARRSAGVTVPVGRGSPGLFTVNGAGSGQAAALNQDGGLNSKAAPAAPGTIVVLFATGIGAGPVAVRVGARDAEVLYAGQAPESVAGLAQINARIPAETAAGDIEVVVTASGGESPAGVTVTVGAQ